MVDCSEEPMIPRVVFPSSLLMCPIGMLYAGLSNVTKASENAEALFPFTVPRVVCYDHSNGTCRYGDMVMLASITACNHLHIAHLQGYKLTLFFST